MDASIQYSYLITTLIAGFLTVLSPCVLPILPIIIGGSTASKSFYKPLRIIGALAVSVTLFTLLVNESSSRLGISNDTWRDISGVILILFGILTLWPVIWEKVVDFLRFKESSHKVLSKGASKGGVAGDLLVGAALGPIFSSCSPTYTAIVLAIIVPQQSWWVSFLYLVSFVVGLILVLVLIALFGHKFINKLTFVNNPKGWFKRILGLMFILVGILIFMNWDKSVEAFLVERGLYDWLINIEDNLPELE